MTRLMLKWPAHYTRLAEEVARKNAVVVPSVNHTGTWFVLGFLSEHPAFGGAVQIQDVLARSALSEGEVVHFHVGGVPTLWGAYDVLLGTGRMVIPLRDPMACLCTRQARHPFLDHSYIVNGFVHIAQNHAGATCMPVDVEAPYRKAVLERVLHALGVTDQGYVDFWASWWKPRNSIGFDTHEKVLYKEGAWDKLRARMNPEVDRLLEARPILVPFLREQGYKELSWWTL